MSRARNTTVLLGAALALLALGAPAWAQTPTPVKMLPPSQFDVNNTPCTPANNSTGLLFWDGVNPIRCAPNTSVDNTATPTGEITRIWLGRYATSGPFPDYKGPELHFCGLTSGCNTDEMYFYRANQAFDRSQLILVLGDNADIPFAVGSQGDAFTIGAYAGPANWRPRFTFTSNGRLGVGTTSPQTKLDVAGTVKIGDGVCNGSTAGSIRWTGARFEGCDGSAWKPLGGSGTVIGGFTRVYTSAGNRMRCENAWGEGRIQMSVPLIGLCANSWCNKGTATKAYVTDKEYVTNPNPPLMTPPGSILDRWRELWMCLQS